MAHFPYSGCIVMAADQTQAEQIAIETWIEGFKIRMNDREPLGEHFPKLVDQKFIPAENARSWPNPYPARWWIGFENSAEFLAFLHAPTATKH